MLMAATSSSSLLQLLMQVPGIKSTRTAAAALTLSCCSE